MKMMRTVIALSPQIYFMSLEIRYLSPVFYRGIFLIVEILGRHGSTEEAEAGRGQPGLCNKFQASEDYIVRTYLKRQQQNKSIK